MEVTESLVYWITRMDHFKECAMYMTCLSGITTILLVFANIIAFCITEEEKYKNPTLSDEKAKAGKRIQRILRNYLLLSSSILLIGIATNAFVPTTRELAAIYVLPAVARSEIVNKTMPKLSALADQWIDNQLGLLKKEEKKEEKKEVKENK